MAWAWVRTGTEPGPSLGQRRDEAEAWVWVRVGRIRGLSGVRAEAGPKSGSRHEQDRDLSRNRAGTGPGSELGQGRGEAESLSLVNGQDRDESRPEPWSVPGRDLYLVGQGRDEAGASAWVRAGTRPDLSLGQGRGGTDA